MASGLIPLGLLFIFTLGKIYKARGKQEEKSKIEIKEKEEINFLKREKKINKNVRSQPGRKNVTSSQRSTTSFI
jgi:hypothetical protein